MRKPSTPFDEDFLQEGFLANYPAEELAEVRSHAAEVFDFADRLNKRLMLIMRGSKPRRTEPVEVLGMLLFVKALNAFQGAVLLCQRGLLVESQALARITLECAIHLTALMKNPSHVDVMLAEYDRHRKTHAEKLLKHHKDSDQSLTPEMIEALTKHTELEGESFKMEQLARSVGMSIAYDSMYRGTSGYGAHATLGALQQLLGEREGEDVNIIFGGDLSRMHHSLTNALLPMVDLIEPVGKILGLNLDRESVRWAHELNAITDKDWKKMLDAFTTQAPS